MKVQLLQITPNAEILIEKIGRVCYASEHLTKEGSCMKFIHNLIARGHESVLEHGVTTFHVSEISRACSHQWVRSRLASHTQRSQRYCKEDDFNYVIPTAIQASQEALLQYGTAMATAQRCYTALIACGCKPEDARMVLPNACHTEITTTMNFRELRHFFYMRCDAHAQEEIQEVSKEMLKIVYSEAPSCFEDIYVKFIGAVE